MKRCPVPGAKSIPCATADLIYATAASLAGTALVALVQPSSRPLRIVGGIATYAQLLGITIIKPLTTVYFVALILGRNGSDASSLAGRTLFVLGAALGSLLWQTVLAGRGSILHERLPPPHSLRLTLCKIVNILRSLI